MPVERKSAPNSSAHFFIIMKKLLLSFVALVCATVSYAQQQLVATLTHGDEITMFYGTYAYRDAMNAAVDGDVINLSGGGFQATTINKAVSIRGAGVEANQPTFIVGNFNINIPAESTERLTMEGLRISNDITLQGTLKNAYFFKNYIESVRGSSGANVKNVMFVNCKVLECRNDYSSYVASYQFLNSYVADFNNNFISSSATACFLNCVINEGSYAYQICHSTLLNCILVNNTSSTWYSLPSSSSATNCLAISAKGGNAFSDVQASLNNKNITDFAVFTDLNYMKDLTDEAKATYFGTDGTPVGMYGGPLPFSFTPTYPQITKMNVASKTTADGKLSVDIEVSSAQ